jgi:hypothetical protein
MRARTKHPLQFESLLSRDQPIWFPGLANRLARDHWEGVGNQLMDYASYSSQRWLDKMPSSSRDTVAVLSLDQRHECQVERLPVEMRLRYQAPEALDLVPPADWATRAWCGSSDSNRD